MNFVRTWRFRPAAGQQREFERAYGPDGDWAQLFRLGDGYLGTELVKATPDGDAYLTIDRWRSKADWLRFLELHGPAYHDLDRRLAPLCAEEEEIKNQADA
jgi:heme-degrading monooxygenase HmoA